MILLKIIWRKLPIITVEVKTGLLQQSVKFNVKKVAVKLSEGGAVTLNELGGLTVYPQVATFLCVYVQNSVEIIWQ